MRRGAVSVLASGLNVGAGPAWGLLGSRAGVSMVLRTAEWARAGGVCCGAGGPPRVAGGTVWAAAHHRACLAYISHAPLWQIR